MLDTVGSFQPDQKEQPEDGDVVICIGCGAIQFFCAKGDKLTIRNATVSEEFDVLMNEEACMLIAAAREAIKTAKKEELKYVRRDKTVSADARKEDL
jgi:hypothetical protein